MKELRLSTSKKIEYPLIFTDNSLALNNGIALIGRDERSKNCLVFVDETVYDLYGEQIDMFFGEKTENLKIVPLPPGDNNKNLDTFLHAFKELNEHPINRRNEPVVIIGGGVVTDVAAFATSCFRRGIPHIKIPTTLMGYVDASVGIKTGINFEQSKNRMGSFYPPLAVILDKSFFKTLSTRDISNGAGEIIKIAVIKDEALFRVIEKDADVLLESKLQSATSDYVLEQAIKDMAEELEPNIFEDDLERVVDFGHTFSLIFEMKSNSEIWHGEAVAMDVLFCSLLSLKRKLITQSEFDRIFQTIQKFQINMDFALFEPNLLWQGLCERTLHRDGLQRTPVPAGIGKCQFLNDITYNELVALCKEMASLDYQSQTI